MGSAIKISFSAVSHIGTACTSNSDKFLQTAFIYTGAADHSQISLEVNDKKCLLRCLKTWKMKNQVFP